jgi:hypothetical protein
MEPANGVVAGKEMALTVSRVNTFWLNVLGWITTAAIFAATVGLVVTWFM